MQTVHVDSMSGAPTTLFILETDRGLTWEVCLQFTLSKYLLISICILIEVYLLGFAIHIFQCFKMVPCAFEKDIRSTSKIFQDVSRMCNFIVFFFFFPSLILLLRDSAIQL